MKLHGAVMRSAEGHFLVKCEPHVMVRIKRVFNRIDKGSHGAVLLTDTPENAHELLWFMERYPMSVEADTLTHLKSRRRAYLDRQAMVQMVLDGGGAPRPFSMALPPRQYQAVAAELWLRSGALLVGDDVGLGKTVIAIAGLTEPTSRPALVVTLTHLPIQWTREISKFAPSLRTHTLKKGRPYPLPPDVDVIISNYHKLSGWADTLAPIINSVIFDEVQELRTGSGFKYKAAEHLCQAATFRLGLSATPIYNYGGEMYSILNCLNPGCLGSRLEFEREWCSSVYGERKIKILNPKAFGKHLREEGLMLRRTRNDVGRELAAVTRIPQHIDADLEAMDRVATSAAELARLILRINPAAQEERFRAAGELSHLLRQATGIAKAPYVAAFVRLLVESGERIVLYGWHHEVYSLWAEQLADLRPAFYTGQETPLQKEEARSRFVKGETPVLIMSLRAGAGLDGLQEVSRTVVFGELDWSPGVHEQCIGRVHRDGQPDPVMAYFLVTDVGSDPVVADVLGLKVQQSEGVRDPDAEMIEKLQVDDRHIKRLAEEYLSQRQSR